jgi:CPA1 family monovalent cation:H+ antiporter
MEARTAIELTLLLLVVATCLAYVARRIGVAYPILLVLGGLVLGVIAGRIPDAPTVELPPEVVFLLFLPPILFGSGYSSQLRDFKANLRPIGLLAVGLVLFTTLVVGVVAGLLVPSLQWAPAFALGAIVAPPDAVAATSVLRRLGVPRRVVTILEGESLVNDASALIAYRVAVAAVVTGSFAALEASISFVVVGVGGIAIGVVVGLLVTGAWRRTGDATLEIILSLIAPIAAYLAAEAVGVSGVLATVTAGLIAGRRAARALSPDGRLLGAGVWSVVYFLIDSFLFMLIGLQLPYVVEGLNAYTTGQLVGLGVVVSATVIVARIVWVFPATYLPRRLSARIRERDPSPPRAAVVVIAWAGMRGAVSLAAALSLPIEPAPFPERNLIIYLTFCVILATLVGQGLSLPWIVGRLGLVAGTGTQREENRARQAAIDAALDRLDDLAIEYPDHLPLVDQLRARFEHEADHAWPDDGADLDEADRERVDHQAIRLSVVEAQREAVIRLRDDGVIGDDALRRVERDLDLEALRSGV